MRWRLCLGHPSKDADARRSFLKKLIQKLLWEEGKALTLAQLTFHVNCVTCPTGYVSKRSKEFKVEKPEVEERADELVLLGLVERIPERRKYDPKKDWPKRYRSGSLLLQLACAALTDEERARVFG